MKLSYKQLKNLTDAIFENADEYNIEITESYIDDYISNFQCAVDIADSLDIDAEDVENCKRVLLNKETEFSIYH